MGSRCQPESRQLLSKAGQDLQIALGTAIDHDGPGDIQFRSCSLREWLHEFDQ